LDLVVADFFGGVSNHDAFPCFRAGLVSGKTGMRAAMAHSPVDNDGRERYFFMAFPHSQEAAARVIILSVSTSRACERCPEKLHGKKTPDDFRRIVCQRYRALQDIVAIKIEICSGMVPNEVYPPPSHTLFEFKYLKTFFLGIV